MDKVLRPQSTVGVCISILFSFFTVAVLTCIRGKSQSMMIKLQFAISVMILNAVMIAGLQGGLSEIPCRVVTILQLYFAVASFAWLTKDVTYITLCIKSELPVQQFRVVCLHTWGIPVPCIGIALLVGLVVKGKIGFKAYTCWPSDHLVWLLILPCLALIISSVFWILKAIKTAKKRFKENTPPISISMKAVRYNLTTNVTLLTLNTFAWVFSTVVFRYPDNESVQLVLGLSNAAQGLFLFFLLCVFNTKEKRIYNMREVKIPVRGPLSKGEDAFELQEEGTWLPSVSKNRIESCAQRAESSKKGASIDSRNSNDFEDYHLTSEIKENAIDTDSICQSDFGLQKAATETVVILNSHVSCHHGVTEARNINNFEDFINASMATCSVKPIWDRNESDDENTTMNKCNDCINISKKGSIPEFKQTSSLPSAESVSGMSRSQCSSRNSITSFSTMNELEILFNNPDLMSGGYPKKNRITMEQDNARNQRFETSTKLPTTSKQRLFSIESNDDMNSLQYDIDQNTTPKEGFVRDNELDALDGVGTSKNDTFNVKKAEENNGECKNSSSTEVKVQVLESEHRNYDSRLFEERSS